MRVTRCLNHELEIEWRVVLVGWLLLPEFQMIEGGRMLLIDPSGG